jgi:hypothetical protein
MTKISVDKVVVICHNIVQSAYNHMLLCIGSNEQVDMGMGASKKVQGGAHEPSWDFDTLT